MLCKMIDSHLFGICCCEQVLAASQSPVQKKWFQGTADAVRQYLWLFENSMREGVEDFLILAGAPLSSSVPSMHIIFTIPSIIISNSQL